MQPIISAIAAMSENHVIGLNNQLPWHLPADLKHFKSMTNGHTILMGRKTYQSIGRPLPNRRNLILTRDKTFQAPGVEVVHSVDDALLITKNDAKLFIIGGGEIYQLFEPYLDSLFLTVIHQTFEGDTLFPLDLGKWREISSNRNEKTVENPYSYTFLELKPR